VHAVLERRSIPAGALVCAVGDCPGALYLLVTGTVEVATSARHGAAQAVVRLGPGATIGELALLSGQPSAVTVRAVEDLELLAITQADFVRLIAQLPRIAQNLGTILAQQLSHGLRATVTTTRGQITRLLDQGGPPLLGYALACSVAWHARRPVLHLVLSAKPPDDLAALSSSAAELVHGSTVPLRRAVLLVVPPEADFGPATLPETLARLTQRYDYVIVQAPDAFPPELAERTMTLAGDEGEIRPGRPGHTMKAWHSGVVVRPDVAGVLHIPPLSLADENALRQGLLSARTPTGRALGWAARDLAGLKVGLALGAGQLKGLAHFGVWRALERLGLEADYVAGSGSGALVGALYALGYSADEAAQLLMRNSERPFRLPLPMRSLLSSAGLRHLVRAIGYERRLEALALPFAVVATDLMRGQAVVLRRGLLRTALLASTALPGLYPPVQVGPLLLVDGGASNPVPGNVAADLGADVVLAVSLGMAAAPSLDDIEALEVRGPLPKLPQVVARAVELMQQQSAAYPVGAALILIEPACADEPTLVLRSFAESEPYISDGEAAVAQALPRIAAALPWLRQG